MEEKTTKYYQLENIIAILPGHIYWKDINGVLRGCNDLQAHDAGLKNRADIVGKTDFEMPWKEQAESLRKIDQEVMNSGEVIVAEEESELADGTRAIFLSQKRPWYDEKGNIIGVVGVSIDITVQKEAEKLRQEKQEAEARSQYLRAAAGSIAHELRTPLASIKMAAQAIANFLPKLLAGYKIAKDAGLKVPEFRAGHLEALESRVASIVQQTNFSNTFIDLVLGNLKEDKDINTDNYMQLGIGNIVNNCLANYPFSGNEADLIHWNPQIYFQIWGDELLMQNVLNNLIKNSLYYIKAANKGEIHIWLEQNEDRNYLYFKDTAKGASQEIIERLFESFYSKRQGGTGLGLAFCKKIMLSMGGDITVSSVENEYMQFVLAFPHITLR